MSDVTKSIARAAEYVRMSTEHQRYSTANQRESIAQYASVHGISIVKTYQDNGRSGLKIRGREALQTLLADVKSGTADFDIIIVYDISRWGRFQDTDESAHYEFICRQAGKRVIYCAEQFDNDGSPLSSIVKGLKRVMAGEYSRELSKKVFHGQSRLASMGFHVGAPNSYGLRRVMIDSHGVIRGEMRYGERKSFQSDKVKLTPGSDAEVAVVRQVFLWFVEEKLYYKHIADRLTAMEVPGPPPNFKWTKIIIRAMVSNEKYRGTMLYNRTSAKLCTPKIKNPPSDWIRVPGAFEAIIDAPLFDAAQVRVKQNPRLNEKGKMLQDLRGVYAEYGRLSATLIRATPDAPSPASLRKYFGSVEAAYKAVGFNPCLDDQPSERKRRSTLQSLLRHLARLISDLRAAGLLVTRIGTMTLRVGKTFTISLVPTFVIPSRPKERVCLNREAHAYLIVDILSPDPEGEFFLLPVNPVGKRSFYLYGKKEIFDADRWRCAWEQIPDQIACLAAQFLFENDKNDSDIAFDLIQNFVSDS